jgi:hypothetical protein
MQLIRTPAPGRSRRARWAAAILLAFAVARPAAAQTWDRAPRADARLRPVFAPAQDAPTLPKQTAVASGSAGGWAMVGLGIGMILAGAKLEETPAEPLGALIRYTGYAVIVFAPFGG